MTTNVAAEAIMIGNNKKIYETMECAICLEDLSEKLAVSSTCGHVFHSVWYPKIITKD
jgi:hypothetical protein